ncbi:MAG: shikimate dehydrogenase [Rhodospirillaceae bacterium]|nr:shikimate dehydrogenase [Rhodospirillaceae bacterium]MYB14079.1 shikimate dehydrogenase [Rhodospirillaceae bacterium]MYI48148.1 shikimate dehydrogenase [Rhodospirillaceae bacterium]
MTGLPSGKAVVAGVAGWPVGHSRSPRLHGHWLQRYGIDGLYAPFPIAPENFETAVRGLAAAGLAGLNVTVPHKAAACALCDRLDDTARRLAAANTLVFGPDGAIEGRNTDAYGFAEALKAAAPEAAAGRGPAVVLGAGGAARAVVLALQSLGYSPVRIANRTAAHAEAAASALGPGVETVPWEERAAALAGAALLVNATSLGMTGRPALDLPLADLPPEATACDIVYAPLETPLLAAARRRGCRAVDGLGMLLHQGRPGFRAWFGVDPAVDDDLRRAVAGDLLAA